MIVIIHNALMLLALKELSCSQNFSSDQPFQINIIIIIGLNNMKDYNYLRLKKIITNNNNK